VGIGPDALISAKFHKAALERCGIDAETFCLTPFYITKDFDLVAAPAGEGGISPGLWRRLFGVVQLVRLQFFRYRCLMLTFHGGALRYGRFLWKWEPFLLRVAGVKTVMVPYGSDVQDMAVSPNLDFKHAMSVDYSANRGIRSKVRSKVDLWSASATHVIAGCEWVDYLHLWDTLLLAHFTIDVDDWLPQPEPVREAEADLVILHAPNHRAIKGTSWLENAVAKLREEGERVELKILERVSNEEIRQALYHCDIVADQFVVGWYAQFALEGMALEKPVLCFCREDLINLYEGAGILSPGELPIVNCDRISLEDTIRRMCRDRDQLSTIGKNGREFVMKHHSIQAMGHEFEKVMTKIGIVS